MLEIHNYVTPFILLLFVFTVSFAVLGSKPFQKEEKESEFVCTECFTVGHRIEKMSGSGATTTILFITGLISWLFINIWFGVALCCAGIAYSMWRGYSVKYVCSCCGNNTLIPVDSPKGKKLLSEINGNCEYQI